MKVLYLLVVITALFYHNIKADLRLDTPSDNIFSQDALTFSYDGFGIYKTAELRILDEYGDLIGDTKKLCLVSVGYCVIKLPKFLYSINATATISTTRDILFGISFELGYHFTINIPTDSQHKTIKGQGFGLKTLLTSGPRTKRDPPAVWFDSLATDVDIASPIALYWSGFELYETLTLSIIQTGVHQLVRANIATDTVYCVFNIPGGIFTMPGSFYINASAPLPSTAVDFALSSSATISNSTAL